MTDKHCGNLQGVTEYSFPRGATSPPEKWGEARPDPDSRSVLTTIPSLRMNGRTIEQVRGELGRFLQGSLLSDEKRLTYACKGANELMCVEVHLQQLMVLAVRDGGKMAQEVMDHLQAHGLVQAFADAVKDRLTELDWTCTPRYVAEMYILWQKFALSCTLH